MSYEQQQLDNWLSLHELTEARHALDALGICAVPDMEHIQEDDLILEGVSPPLAARIVDVIHSTYAVRGLQKASTVPSHEMRPGPALGGLALGTEGGHVHRNPAVATDRLGGSTRQRQRVGYFHGDGPLRRRMQQRHQLPVHPPRQPTMPRRGLIRSQSHPAPNLLDYRVHERRGGAPPEPHSRGGGYRHALAVASRHPQTGGIAPRRSAPRGGGDQQIAPRSSARLHPHHHHHRGRGGYGRRDQPVDSIDAPNYFSESSDSDSGGADDDDGGNGMSLYSSMRGVEHGAPPDHLRHPSTHVHSEFRGEDDERDEPSPSRVMEVSSHIGADDFEGFLNSPGVTIAPRVVGGGGGVGPLGLLQSHHPPQRHRAAVLSDDDADDDSDDDRAESERLRASRHAQHPPAPAPSSQALRNSKDSASPHQGSDAVNSGGRSSRRSPPPMPGATSQHKETRTMATVPVKSGHNKVRLATSRPDQALSLIHI